jgi:hypothetical protein
MRRLVTLFAGLTVSGALTLAASAAAEENVVAPAYPSETRDKPVTVNVVARGEIGAGKVTGAEVLFNDGPGAFATSARAALEGSTFDAGRESATIWYVFRLMQDTKVNDISRGRDRGLDAQPELVGYVAPEFLPGAPSLQAEVSLQLLVGPDGAVWYAEPADDGTNQLYVDSALVAARQFKFEPATLDGEPTATWYPFVIDFK